MRILIAVDGSPASDAVIQEAAARPWPKGTEMCVVTAVDPYFFTRAPLLLEEMKLKTNEGLEESARPLREAGWAVSTNAAVCNPRHGLSKIASEWKAEFILLGSHGRGAFTRLLMGSTAQAVMRHASCSVEIVRAREKRQVERSRMRVLIPTDGSEYARMALHSVIQRPWPAGSEFLILSCPELPVIIGEFPFYASDQVIELANASELHAAESAASGAELLSNVGLRVSRQVTEPEDAPPSAILAAADSWEADLIAMGSHGRRGFDRVVLGSVSESVAMHARCSVEVIRKA
jgi:nucleotide-binding universal stress UspA family protein